MELDGTSNFSDHVGSILANLALLGGKVSLLAFLGELLGLGEVLNEQLLQVFLENELFWLVEVLGFQDPVVLGGIGESLVSHWPHHCSDHLVGELAEQLLVEFGMSDFVPASLEVGILAFPSHFFLYEDPDKVALESL